MLKFLAKPQNLVLVYIVLASIIDARLLGLGDLIQDVILVSILLLAIIIYWNFSLKRDTKKFINLALEWPNVLVLTYLFWGLITLGYSINKSVSLSYIIGGFIVFLAVFVVIKNIFSVNIFKVILYSTGLAGLIAALYSFVLLSIQIINPTFVSTFALLDINFSESIKVLNIPVLISYIRHPNTFGALMFYAFASTVVLIIVENGTKWSRYVFVASIVIFIALVLSFSRAAILAGLIFTFLISVPAFKLKQFIIPIYFVLLLLVFGGFLLNENVGLQLSLGTPRPFSQIQSTSDETSFNEFAEEEDLDLPRKVNKRGLTSRDVIWESSFNYINENPIFGAGFGNSPAAIESGIPENYSRFRGLTPHNTYLRTAVETGVIGLILYISILGTLLILFLKKIRKITLVEWSLLSIVGAVAAYQIFETNFLLGTGFRSFYFVMFLSGGYALLRKL